MKTKPRFFTDKEKNQVIRMKEIGMTDAQIIHALGCGRSTFYRAKQEDPEFQKAYEEADNMQVEAVERSLYQRSMGSIVPEDKVTAVGDIVRVLKHYPPDTAAAIFYLKNKRPEEWTDKRVIEAPEGKEPIIFKINGDSIKVG